MKKKIVTIILFTLMTFIINAQSNELIIGKWIFKDVYNKEKIDRVGLEILKTEVINKMTFDFKKNGEFEAYMMGEIQKGTWILTEGFNKIILNIHKEFPIEFVILQLTKNELALKLGFGEFLMIKSLNKPNG